jgi:hypothetical protein
LQGIQDTLSPKENLTHVGNIKQSGLGADGFVFLLDAAKLHGHLPPGKLGHPGLKV